jgi:hypothetical protein
MSTTKKKPLSMTQYQKLNHLLRNEGGTLAIVGLCRDLLNAELDKDFFDGPSAPHIVDMTFALWTMATKLAALRVEVETLKRRSRRDNRKTNPKPAAELLKQQPAQLPG